MPLRKERKRRSGDSGLGDTMESSGSSTLSQIGNDDSSDDEDDDTLLHSLGLDEDMIKSINMTQVSCF